MREQPAIEHGHDKARWLVIVYRLGIVVAVLATVLLAVRLYLSQVGFYFLFPYPPPWWARLLLWLLA